MEDTLEEMKNRCDALAKSMGERGMLKPTASIEVRSGEFYARVTLNYANCDSAYPDRYEFFSAATIAEACKAAELWVLSQMTADERAVQDALELTAKALEASRKAGLDTGEGAAFVAQLELMMKRLSENAITDQSAAEIVPPEVNF